MATGQNDNSTVSSQGVAKDTKTLMGVLAYLGPLVFVPYFVEKADPFVKFHVKQGFVLFGIEVVLWLLSSMLWNFWMLWQIVNLGIVVLAILGIVNVVQGKQASLPIVGKFSEKIPL